MKNNQKRLFKILVLSTLFALIGMFAACVKPPQALTTPTNVRIENGVLRWDMVEGADEYIVYNSFNGEEVTVKTNEYNLSFIQEEGDYQIEVAAVKQEKNSKIQTEWVAATYNNYSYLKKLVFTKIEGREAYEVAKEKGAQLESTVVIPATYNGLPVVKVAQGAFCNDILYVTRSPWPIYEPNYDYVIQKIVLPDTIEEIGRCAFALCRALKEVNIPEGVKTIGQSTFFHCESLNNIVLPSTLEAIDKEAFGISALTEITIPESVKTIGDNAFGYCIKLKQIKLPDQVTVVSDKLFYGCSSLQQVELPQKAESIGESSFKNCTALNQIAFPQALTSIGDNAFSGCTALSNITFPNNMENTDFLDIKCFENTAWYNNLRDGLIIINGKYLFGYKGELPGDGKLVIPQYIEKITTKSTFSGLNVKSAIFECELNEIPQNLFSRCLYLEEVILKGNIKSISAAAFNYCRSLTKVVLPDTVENIGEMAFKGTGVTNLDFLPDSVKTIEEYAFSDSALETAHLPKNAVLTGGLVFSFCKSLTSAKIYSGTCLPNSTFQVCEKLTDITLNEGMEEIQSMAFSGCAIKNFDFLPSTIKTIGQFAFENCPLEEIRYPKELQSTEKMFGNKVSVKMHILPVALTKVAFYVQAENLYYEGTQEQFDSAEKKIQNKVDTSKIAIYYYAESSGDIIAPTKNYWHYATDGKTPIVWEL